jgi:hypothetical protein
MRWLPYWPGAARREGVESPAATFLGRMLGLCRWRPLAAVRREEEDGGRRWLGFGAARVAQSKRCGGTILILPSFPEVLLLLN